MSNLPDDQMTDHDGIVIVPPGGSRRPYKGEAWGKLIAERDAMQDRLLARVRHLEEALALAEVTFNDFVMALHLLRHEPMAQAARIARDAAGEALRQNSESSYVPTELGQE